MRAPTENHKTNLKLMQMVVDSLPEGKTNWEKDGAKVNIYNIYQQSNMSNDASRCGLPIAL